MPDTPLRYSLAALLLLAAAGVSPPAEAQRAAYYVLDGFGGVHAGGGAPAISRKTPYFGFDIARDIAFVPYGTSGRAAGDGVLVLDGFGGVHTGGALPSSQAGPPTPYFAFDAARAIAFRNVPPRAEGSTGDGGALISMESATFTAISSATMVAPDDGFLLVAATGSFGCSAVASGDLWVAFGLDVDSTAGDAAAEYGGYIESCDSPAVIQTVAITRLFPVAAGGHTVNLLARKISASSALIDLKVRKSSVVVLYVDLSGDGSS